MNYIVDYKMVDQYKVEIGSLWDYNRSLDNSPITRKLKVKRIYSPFNNHQLHVEFEQTMPFRSYGIYYFDGYVFKPSLQ